MLTPTRIYISQLASQEAGCQTLAMSMDWRSWFIPNRGQRKGPVDSLRDPRADDLAQIEALRLAGSKLNLPHPVRNFLLLPGEKEAREAAARLVEEGYSCQLRALDGTRWQVTAVVQLVPRPGAVTRIREQLEEIASVEGGEYAGWDSPLVY